MYERADIGQDLPFAEGLSRIEGGEAAILVVRQTAVADPSLAVRLSSHLRALDLFEIAGISPPRGVLSAAYPTIQPLVRFDGGRAHAKARQIEGVAGAAFVLAVAQDEQGGAGVAVVAPQGIQPDRLFGLQSAGLATLSETAWAHARFYPIADSDALDRHRAYALRLSAAIDLGIAEAAQRDTVSFVHSRTRPWFEAATETGPVAAHDEQQVIFRYGQLAIEFHIAEALLRRADRLAAGTGTQVVRHAYAAAAEARAASSEIAVTLATELFSICGTRSTDTEDNLGRHWRDARVHSFDADIRGLWHQAGRHSLMFDHLPVPDDNPYQPIGDSTEALRAAQKLAAEFRPGSARRDRERIHPEAALRRIAETGLLSIGVPTDRGGLADLSRAIAYQVIRLLSTGDASVGQISMIHFSFVDQILRHGTPEQQAEFIPQVLQGARFSNGTAERHTEHAKVVSTRLLPDGLGGYILNGQKYYCTGSVGADWLSILAQDEQNRAVSAIVHKDDPGLVIENDWEALGQRSTGSGGVKAVDVRVPAHRLKGFWLVQDVPNIAAGAANLGHVAVDLGIIENALDDILHFLNAGGQDSEASFDRDDPLRLYTLGRLAGRVHAAQQLFDDAVSHYERITAGEITDVGGKTFSLEISEAKAFIGDLSYEIGNVLFDLVGPAALLAEDAYDRHWRNGRTHTLHDPNRWKYYRAGDHFLNGRLPPRNRNN